MGKKFAEMHGKTNLKRKKNMKKNKKTENLPKRKRKKRF